MLFASLSFLYCLYRVLNLCLYATVDLLNPGIEETILACSPIQKSTPDEKNIRMRNIDMNTHVFHKKKVKKPQFEFQNHACKSCTTHLSILDNVENSFKMLQRHQG
jgi:hypothetical protein